MELSVLRGATQLVLNIPSICNTVVFGGAFDVAGARITAHNSFGVVGRQLSGLAPFRIPENGITAFGGGGSGVSGGGKAWAAQVNKALRLRGANQFIHPQGV